MIGSSRPPFDAIRLPDGDPAFLHLCWMLHNQCNHRCSYCSEVNWGGSHRWLKLESAIGFVERVLAHYPNRRIMVSFTGGEPTLWPDFGHFIEWLASRGILIGLTTNGTKPIAFFEKYSKYFDWMSFSFHPEFTRPEKFLENVAEASKSSHATIRAMMPEKQSLWQKSTDLIALARRWDSEKRFASDVGVDVVPLAIGFGTEHTKPEIYSEEQNDFFRAPPVYLDGNDYRRPTLNPLDRFGYSNLATPSQIEPFDTTRLLSQNRTDFRGWTCDIGLEQLFIDEKGEVVRAGCRVGGKLGHIFDENLKFPTAPIRCVKSYCHCNTDILTSKRSPEWEKQFQDRKVPTQSEASYRLQLFRYELASVRSRWHEGVRPSPANLPVFTAAYLILAAARLTVAIEFMLRAPFVFWGSPPWQLVRRKLLKPYYFLRFQYQKRVLRRPQSDREG